MTSACCWLPAGTSVLGTIGAHLAAATIPASLLVVHGAHSSVELTHRQHHLSLSKVGGGTVTRGPLRLGPARQQ